MRGHLAIFVLLAAVRSPGYSPLDGQPAVYLYIAALEVIVLNSWSVRPRRTSGTAALIALLHALKCEHKVIDPQPYQLSRQQLRVRAAEIAQGNWASKAVRKAIDDEIAAGAAVVMGVAAGGAALGFSR